MAADAPECYACKHFRPDNRDRAIGEAPPCAAFPKGIPTAIFFGEAPQDADPDLTDQEVRVLHHKPYPGDNGFQFESASQTEAAA